MRFNEIANADDQLVLWRLISDNVWSAVRAQAKEQARLRAQAAAAPKPKKNKPKKLVPKKPPALKPPPLKSSVPKPVRIATPSQSPTLPSSQPVLRPTRSSSFSQADALAVQSQPSQPT